jgi:hypothetical protein
MLNVIAREINIATKRFARLVVTALAAISCQTVFYEEKIKKERISHYVIS